MRRGAVTCTEDKSIREVAQIMVVNRLRYCVVVNGRNEIQGIISSRSILKAFGKNLDTTRAGDILIPYTVTVTQNTAPADAVKLMQEKKVEHIIVISDKSKSKVILGILSAADIVRHMAQRGKGQE